MLRSACWAIYNKRQSLLKDAIATRNSLFEYQSKMYNEFGYNWFLTENGFYHRKQVSLVVKRINNLRRKINQMNMILQKRGFTANKYTIIEVYFE
jgi:hypothetical protein